MAFPSLQSGVIYDSQFPNIQKGSEAVYAAMGQIVGQKIQDEQSKQAIYNELLNIGLEEIKGKYQDEAVQIKSQILKNTAKIFSETEGMPSAEQLRQINADKGKLTNYAKMYSGMEDWYRNASMIAAQIPSPMYRQKTIDNITEIMSQPTLTDTWDQILSKNWLQLPPPEIDIYDIRDNILKNADEVNQPFDPVNVDKYGNVSYESWKGKNPNQIVLGAEFAWENKEGLKDKFPDIQSWVDFVGTGREYQNVVKGRYHGGGSGSKNEPILLKFNQTTKQWEAADINKGEGIKLAEFTKLGGENPISDAKITTFAPEQGGTTPKWAKIVSPSIKDMSWNELTGGMDPEDKRMLMMFNPNLIKGKTEKEPLKLDSFWVPYEWVKPMAERHVKLEIPNSNTNKNPLNLPQPPGLSSNNISNTTPQQPSNQNNNNPPQNQNLAGTKINFNTAKTYSSVNDPNTFAGWAQDFIDLDADKYDPKNMDQLKKMLNGLKVAWSLTGKRGSNTSEQQKYMIIADNLDADKSKDTKSDIKELQYFIANTLK